MISFEAAGSSVAMTNGKNTVAIFTIDAANRLIDEIQAAKVQAKANLANERQARKDAIVDQIAALNAELDALRNVQLAAQVLRG